MTQTMDEFLNQWYNPHYTLRMNPLTGNVTKAITTSSTGVYNAVYGKNLFMQFNTVVDGFAVLPEFPWDNSGLRVASARGATTGGGIAQGTTVPAASDPTFVEADITAKLHGLTYQISLNQHLLAQTKDDASPDRDKLMAINAENVRFLLNFNAWRDADNTAGNNIESVDRIVADNDEVALVNANDLDLYGEDRDAAASWIDGNVYDNDNTDRALSTDLLLTARQGAHAGGGKPTVWVTGFDTERKIIQLFDSQGRYSDFSRTDVSIGVNGVSTVAGQGVGLNVASIYGVPLIASQSIAVDTISRVYLLDTSDPEGFGIPRTGFMTLMPVQHFVQGVTSTGDMFGINYMGDKGGHFLMGETYCRRFVGNSKIRDLL